MDRKNTTYTEQPQLGGALISRRVVTQLLAAIQNGRYAKVNRLPAELELADEFGVSRTVIRDALSDLEREGYIERVRGIGTVVNHSVANLQFRLDHKLEYEAMIRTSGHTPHVDSVQVTQLPAAPTIAAALGCRPGTRLLRIRKRILADDAPVIYSVDFLPADLLDSAHAGTPDYSRPIFDLLEQLAHVQLPSAVTHTRAVVGDADIRQALQCDAQDALLLLEEVGYDRLCHPVLYSHSYYTNFFDFSVLRKIL